MSTPYQIRADLLSLVRDVLTENAHMRLRVAADLKQPLAEPPIVTTEEIVAEAEKLYIFVSKK